MDNKESICNELNKALDLEIEGYEFYRKCAERTKSKEGRDMFKYLAREEQDHYKKVESIYKKKFDKGYCEYEKKKAKSVVLFNVLGVNLDEKTDALDALNIAIKAEKKSISLYEKLAKETASDKKMKNLFEQLVKEEKKHLVILETDREFITETGAYYDFKIVTM